MKRLVFISIMVFCHVEIIRGQQVSKQEAIQAAVNTMRYYGKNNISLNLVDTVFSMVNQGDTLLYEVHFETGETVLLSGHKACVPVLGYITEGHGETILNQYDQIPDGLRDFIDEYAAYSQFFFDTISELVHLSDWEALQTYDRDMKITRVVEPLTTSKWGQSWARFRYYFPDVNGYDSVPFFETRNHAYNYYILDTCRACDDAIYSPAGCPAIAMAQIMYYWKYPVFMEDSVKQYKWCNMTDNLGDYSPMGTIDSSYAEYLFSTHRDAIAMLIRDCAGRADTKYCSGNKCQSSSGPVRTKNAFKKFGYSNVDLKWKIFNQKTWKTMLKTDLDNGCPICYSSGNISTLEGHTYVCDGYNDDDKFSFNWGWNGLCNGYFYPLDSLENMNDLHSAIFKIVPDDSDNYCDYSSNLYDYYLNHPDKIPYEITPKTFTRLESVTSIEDATGYYRTIPQNAQAEYTAHEIIVLRDGFHAEAGSSFRAYITPCESCETPSRNGSETQKMIVETQNFIPTESLVEASCPIKGMTIYPNPNTGMFHVGFCDKQDAVQKIAVFGILGNQVMVESNLRNGVVNVSHIPSGIYVIKVLTKQGNVYFEKFVKE